MSTMRRLVPKTQEPARPDVRRVEAPAPAAPSGTAAGILRMQRTVGNRSVGRMLVQRAGMGDVHVAEDRMEETLRQEAVAAVRSFHVDQNLVKEGVGGARKQLDQRLKQREDTLKKYLAQVGENSKVGEAVAANLEKKLKDILDTPDSRFVNPGLRQDVVRAYNALDARQQAAAEGERRFHRHDAIFASREVAATLAARGFTPAELKALVSQESGDLTAGEGDGNIAGPAGPAQIDLETARSVEDPTGTGRLTPATAIPEAARVLVKKARALESMLQEVPTGEEFKKFVYATYNAGEGTIQVAQKLAKEMGRPGTTWNDLIRPAPGKGVESTPFYRAASRTLAGKVAPGDKYRETTGYVERIRGRLGLQDAAEQAPAAPVPVAPAR